MTGPEPVTVRLRGLTQESVDDAMRAAMRAVRPKLERALDADDDDRQRAVSELAAAVLVEGIRFTWSELAAQLIEAGVDFSGTLDIETDG